MPLHADERLAELNYGPWEGLADADVWQRWPEERARWWDEPDALRLEGAETLETLQERAWRGLIGCLTELPGDLLVVAHGGTNRALLSRMLSLPLRSFWRLSQDACALNVIELPPGEPAEALVRARVRVINDTSHLG